jgi:cytochrome P450
MAVNKAMAAVAPATQFDLNDLESRSATQKLLGWVLSDPRWLFWLLRRWPWAGFRWFGNWTFVGRFDDVREVLTHNHFFRVPYGKKTKDLNGGPNFLLGMEDTDESSHRLTQNDDGSHRRCQELVMQAFRLEDVRSTVTRKAAEHSSAILNNNPGCIDAIEGLLTRVAILICRDYYGLTIPNPTEFGHWTIAMSTHIFVDAASVVPAHRRAAEAAASFVRALVNEAIADRQKTPRADGTVLSRLIKMQAASKGELTDEVIRAFLIGMVMGFVPTNTLAGGNILAVLLRKRKFMAQAQEAALAGDDDLLRRCLFEALRFKHIHWGLTRICTDDYTIAARTSRKKLVRAGTKVLASTWSAMFDGSRVAHPGVFDSSRRPADYMLLGYGLHWCVGAHIAYAHITQTFKQLLLQKDLRPAEGKAGQLQLLGTFPQHLWVEFTPKRSIKGGVP